MSPAPRFTPEMEHQIRVMWEDGEMTALQIATMVGVTRSVILGMAHRRDWGLRGPCKEHSTTMARLDALHASMDRLLAETKNIPRLPPP